MKYLLKKINYPLLLILILTALLRFGGINWCFPYAPHPDEWNMAAAVTRLSPKNQLNPDFFAYGQFPLYLSYSSAKIFNFFSSKPVNEINLQEAVFFLRFWSAIAGVGIVSFVYFISKKILTTYYSLLATLLAAFTPGLIQTAHFGTTESLLSFFFLLIVFLSFKITESPKLKYFAFLGIVLGLALGTKISALAFAVPIVVGYLASLRKNLKNPSSDKQKEVFSLTLKYCLVPFLSLVFALISSPYLLFSFAETKRILLYETMIATGKLPVFYTRQFINTLPILFQLEKIFPFTLGWPIFILGSVGFFLSIISLIKSILKKKNYSLTTYYLLLTTPFAVYFLSQSFLFCKWTRFMAPIFAFFPIFAGILLSYLGNLRYFRCVLVFLAIIPGLIFSSVYFQPDIRFVASDWIYQNLPSESQILFDTGNVVDIPVPSSTASRLPKLPGFRRISFDFYNLDENPELFSKLINYLETSDYIIVPSRRIFANVLRLPDKYPLAAKYYSLLFSGKLGFSEIKTFSVISSKISKDEEAEETFTVFDHPTIRIYQKKVILKKNDYENLFQL